MSFSYALSNSMSALHKVRMYINDTDKDDFLLHDEEINNGPLATFPSNHYRAAAEAALMCAAKLGRLPDRSAMGMSDSPGRTADFYFKLSDQLIAKATRNGLQVFAGGRSRDAKIDLATEIDKTQPAFRIGRDDHPHVDHQDAASTAIYDRED